MALSHELISQFAKLVNNKDKQQAAATVYGTVVEDGDNKYVRVDGSDQLIPIEDGSTVVDAYADERVSVTIKDHTATVTGNVSSPAARTGDVKDVTDRVTKIEKFDLVLAERIEAQEGYIEDLQADMAEIGDLKAATAKIEQLEANDVKITGDLEASNAEITNLKTTKLDVEVADAKFATIENLDANTAKINQLDADKASVTDLDAVEADILELNTKKLDAEQAEVKYANIDFTNITKATIENFFTKSGMIENVIIGDSTITGALVGVTIKGDLIEAGTVKADKLVVKGDNGLYYKLNIDAGVTTSEEISEEDLQNGLHGDTILAHTITAEKISVHDLVAFGADIGGFKIDSDAIHSFSKTSADSSVEGIYMGSDGQFNVGNGSNYLKFFKDQNGEWKLEIRLSGGKTVEEAIADEVDKVQIGGRNLLLNSSFKESINEWETIGDVLHEQKSVSGYGVVSADDISDKAPATVQLASKNLFDPASVVDGFVSSSGQYVLSESGEKSFLVQCKPNTNYTLSKLQTSKLRILGCDSMPTNAMAGEILVNSNTQTNTTFNSGDNTYLVAFYLNNTGETYTNDEVVSSMMLEVGTTATSYMPYLSLNDLAESSVTACGKNLLSPTFNPSYTQYGGVTFTDNGDGTVTVNGTAAVAMWIEFFGKQLEGDPNHAVRKGSYVFNDFKNITASTFRTALLAFTPNKELLRTFEHYNSSVLVDIPQDAYLTYQIRISGGTTFDNVILKPQLEFGTTATEYEPYKELGPYTADENGLVTIDAPYSPIMTVMSDADGINLDMVYSFIGNEFSEKYGKPCLWLKHTTLDKEKSLYQSVAGKLEPDTQYTLSGWLLSENVTEGSSNFGLTFHHQGVSGESTAFSYGSIPFEVNASVGSWKHVSLTFTTDSNSANPTSEDIYIHTQDLIGDVYFCDLKLERGNRVSDWTPAPEDMDNAIDDVRNSVLSETRASLEVTEKSVLSKVEETYVNTDSFDSYKSHAKSEVEQTASDITINFETTMDGLENKLDGEIEKREKHFKITEDGLIISAGANSVRVVVNNDLIAFIKGSDDSEQILGYWDGNNFYAGNLTIRVDERAQFGNFAAIPRSNGNLSWLKVK